ncbi:unnamed protein product [Cunninghamella echinulata]
MNVYKLLRINNNNGPSHLLKNGLQSFYTSSRTKINQYRTPVYQVSIPQSTEQQKHYIFNNKPSSCNTLIKRHMSATLNKQSTATASTTTTSTSVAHTKPIVGYWLYFNAGLVFSIVIVGGLTRLTESGLSITEWNVIAGMKPPRFDQNGMKNLKNINNFLNTNY